jgi:hypothetical protein
VTGALDAFRWRVPVEAIDQPAGALLSAKVEALVGLGAGADPVLAHTSAVQPVAAYPPTETAEAVDQPAIASVEPAREAAPLPKPVVTTPAAAAPAAMPVAPPPVAANAAVDADVVASTNRSPPAEAVDEDELRERIRLAAQRAIASSSAPATVTVKPTFTKSPAPKPAAVARTQAPAPPPRVRKTVEPKIFVPPRAPDDPGPDPIDGDDIDTGPLRPAKV